MPETAKGREVAVAALQARRVKNKDKKPINNASLFAGSPMYFNCISCNGDIVVAESYTSKPDLCPECSAMRKLGWLI